MTPEPWPALVTTWTTEALSVFRTCGNVGVGTGVGRVVAVGKGVAVGRGVGIVVGNGGGVWVGMGDGIGVGVGANAVGDGSTTSSFSTSLPHATAVTRSISSDTVRNLLSIIVLPIGRARYVRRCN